MSIFPLTSPMMMPLRIPMDVPLWELLLSMGLLALTAILAVYLSGRVFRAGLLLYGAKPKFSTLFKWLKDG
jgi:ABC-2 type transport system permease protein